MSVSGRLRLDQVNKAHDIRIPQAPLASRHLYDSRVTIGSFFVNRVITAKFFNTPVPWRVFRCESPNVSLGRWCGCSGRGSLRDDLVGNDRWQLAGREPREKARESGVSLSSSPVRFSQRGERGARPTVFLIPYKGIKNKDLPYGKIPKS